MKKLGNMFWILVLYLSVYSCSTVGSSARKRTLEIIECKCEGVEAAGIVRPVMALPDGDACGKDGKTYYTWCSFESKTCTAVHHFVVINKLTKKEVGIECRGRCPCMENDCDCPSGLDQPVIDTSGKFYRNECFARCEGVTDFMPVSHSIQSLD